MYFELQYIGASDPMAVPASTSILRKTYEFEDNHQVIFITKEAPSNIL